jgi:D-alanine-D-alanine ligase
MPKKTLFVVCAVDEDVSGPIRSGRPRSYPEKWDASVFESLRSLYTRVELMAVKSGDLAALEALRSSGAGVVFNLALSATPLEPAFAACVEFAGLRCTGSGMLAIALANDKIRSRVLLRDAGIRVPRFIALAPGANPNLVDLTPPLIVKPAYQGSSWGISSDSVVMTKRDLLARARRIWKRFDEPAVADEFVQGRELRAGLIEGREKRFQIVGVAEWTFPEGARGFRIEGGAKHNYLRLLHARQLNARLRSEIAAIAQTSFETLGIRGYASLDLRLDELNRLTILEVNANPGISSDSPIWAAHGFDNTIRRIVEAALR